MDDTYISTRFILLNLPVPKFHLLSLRIRPDQVIPEMLAPIEKRTVWLLKTAFTTVPARARERFSI